MNQQHGSINPFNANVLIGSCWCLSDPRPDIKEDHDRWHTILRRLFECDRRLWGTFYSLRCGGSRAVIVNEVVTIQLPQDWDFMFKAKVRKKYLMPRASAIEQVLAEAH